jgi:4-amino-4-deoxy-L-arabinose transferase-like glycosyltransferase
MSEDMRTLVAGRERWLDRAPVQYIVTGLLAAVVVFWQLGSAALEEHEAKAGLGAKGMLPGQQWLGPQLASPDPIPADTWYNRLLIPTNNGQIRLEKTPLPYWLMVGVSRASGCFSEWTIRMPSAIAAVLLVWVTLALGRKMLNPRAALLGALALLATVGFQKWGRSSRPDMLLTLMITAAMACMYLAVTTGTLKPRNRWLLAFWVLMGLANMCKQFYPLVLGVPVLAYIFWNHSADNMDERRVRRLLATYLIIGLAGVAVAVVVTVSGLAMWQRLHIPGTPAQLAVMVLSLAGPLAWYAIATGGWRRIVPLLPTSIPGILIMFAAFIPWMWYMDQLFGMAAGKFNEEVAVRAAGTGGWRSAQATYYFMPLLAMTLPWLALLPGAFVVPWLGRYARQRPGLVFLFLWSVCLPVLLTLSAGKREHYILPMAPAICLLMGFVATDVFGRNDWVKPGLGRLLAIAYGVAGLVAPLVLTGIWWAAAHPEWGGKLRQSRAIAQALEDIGDPSRWLHMTIVAGIAAVPMLAILVAGVRNRLAPVTGLLAVTMVLVYAGFYTRVDLWDSRSDIASFAGRAAIQVGPEAPAGSWGDPQMKTVFYFGRNIPNVKYTEARIAREQPNEKLAQRLWRQWLSDPEHVAWLFCYRQYASDARPLVGPTQVDEIMELGKWRVVMEEEVDDVKCLNLVLLKNQYGPLPEPTTAPAETNGVSSNP